MIIVIGILALTIFIAMCIGIYYKSERDIYSAALLEACKDIQELKKKTYNEKEAYLASLKQGYYNDGGRYKGLPDAYVEVVSCISEYYEE